MIAIMDLDAVRARGPEYRIARFGPIDPGLHHDQRRQRFLAHRPIRRLRRTKKTGGGPLDIEAAADINFLSISH